MAEFESDLRPATVPVPDDASDELAAGADANIPMLTDVLQLPRHQGELPAALSEVDWAALTLRVREKVMGRLLRRSDLMLDDTLNETLRAVLDRAAETLAVELHDALSQMIRDLVTRVVGEELARVQTEITRRKRDNPPSPATGYDPG
jgi:hypothetical protein